MNRIAMNHLVRAIISWLIILWACKVFLFSLPYKFTNHPDTQHIFGTIGTWLGEILGARLGLWFTEFGAYVVGSFELLTSIVLLLPALLWGLGKIGCSRSSHLGRRAQYHRIGGLMAAAVMAGAAFFHLFTPLGIEVLHLGQSDGGELFYAATSILVLGIVLFLLNLDSKR